MSANPMAEALAEDAAAAAAAAKAAETPAEAPAAEPAAETPATEATAADETAAPAETDPKVAETPKPKKTTIQVMQDRIGVVTAEKKTLAEQLAESQRQNKAMADLLAAQGKTVPAAEPAASVAPAPAATPLNGERLYTQTELDERARQIAYMQDLNARADVIYATGAEKFGDWGDAISGLNAVGVMSPALVEAASATGAPVDVLHALGSDLAEAQRIASLHPVQMGVELAKLATKSAAKPAPKPISAAPAPTGAIKVEGAVTPTVDFAKLAEGDNMAAYVAARKAAGDRWAK